MHRRRSCGSSAGRPAGSGCGRPICSPTCEGRARSRTGGSGAPHGTEHSDVRRLDGRPRTTSPLRSTDTRHAGRTVSTHRSPPHGGTSIQFTARARSGTSVRETGGRPTRLRDRTYAAERRFGPSAPCSAGRRYACRARLGQALTRRRVGGAVRGARSSGRWERHQPGEWWSGDVCTRRAENERHRGLVAVGASRLLVV